MTAKRTTRVHASEKLAQSPDKQPGLRWPEAVDQVVDRMVEAANNAGANTTRRELVAAVMVAQERDGANLLNLLVDYRTITVGQALHRDSNDGDIIDLPRSGPGRRPREGAN